jgi:hypothetical protein
MPIGVGVAVAGGLGAAATVGSSAIAANAASSAASHNNALESQIYQTNSANEQPYIQSGDAANIALQGFLGLGGSPEASQTALNNYLSSTGYHFTLNQGLDAAESNAASKGLLNSGSTLEALDNYGAGVAQQYGQTYEGDLAGVASTGANAANALAGQGENYANSVSTNNNSAASATANAALAGGSTANSLIGNALTAYAFGQGGSSFGGTSPSSIGNALGSYGG